MKWSYRIATVAGIEVRVHVTFFLLLAFYAWMYYTESGLEAALVYGVFFTLLLFLCVVLHEFGHAFAARAFGVRTPDITLLPIGGVARLERMPSNPWQELTIALAGPAVNVVIAVFLALILGGIPSLLDFLGISGGLLARLFYINLFLVVFNMIPAFPMDGGRVLRALLATQLKHGTATFIAARVGQGIAVLFVLASFTPWGSPMLMFIAAFVFLGAQQELAYARLRESARGRRVGQAMITRFETMPHALQVGEIGSFLLGSRQTIYPVVDDYLQFHGFVERADLLRAAKEMPPQSPANSLARSAPEIRPDTSVEEAFDAMQRANLPILPVVNASRQIVGLFSLAEMGAAGAPAER